MNILMAINHWRNPNSGAAGTVEEIGFRIRELGHKVHFLFRHDLMTPALRINTNLGSISDVPVHLVTKTMESDRDTGPHDILDISSGEGYLLACMRHRLGLSGKYIFRSHGLEMRQWRDFFLKESTLGEARFSLKFRLWFPLVRLRQEKKALWSSDRIVVMCTEDRLFLKHTLKVEEGKVALIPPGVSERLFDYDLRRARDRDLLFVGWWGSLKGTKYLSKAFEQVTSSHPEATLSVIGSGVEDEIVYASFPSSLRANVRVRSSLSQEKLFEEYLTHKILVFPSVYEGFGKVLLEAMAAGMAVVATDLGGARDTIETGVDGLLIPPRSSEELSKAILFLMEDGQAREKLGESAREKARGYTWTKTVEQTLRLFEELRDQ